MTWVRQGGCVPVSRWHTGISVLMEGTQNFWNKHSKLDADFALGTKKEGSRGRGLYLPCWHLSCSSWWHYSETTWRKGLFCLCCQYVCLSWWGGLVEQSRALQCPGSRELNWLFSPFPSLSKQLHSPWNEGTFFTSTETHSRWWNHLAHLLSILNPREGMKNNNHITHSAFIQCYWEPNNKSVTRHMKIMKCFQGNKIRHIWSMRYKHTYIYLNKQSRNHIMEVSSCQSEALN